MKLKISAADSETHNDLSDRASVSKFYSLGSNCRSGVSNGDPPYDMEHGTRRILKIMLTFLPTGF